MTTRKLVIYFVCLTLGAGFVFGAWMFANRSPGFQQKESSEMPLHLASHIQEEPILPITTADNLPAERVALGSKLFFDRRLSHDNTIACASCHDLKQGGAEHKVHSTGINGAE